MSLHAGVGRFLDLVIVADATETAMRVIRISNLVGLQISREVHNVRLAHIYTYTRGRERVSKVKSRLLAALLLVVAYMIAVDQHVVQLVR